MPEFVNNVEEDAAPITIDRVDLETIDYFENLGSSITNT